MSDVTWWRGRVHSWRYVKIPVSIGLIVFAVGGGVASLWFAPSAFLALLWLPPIGLAIASLLTAREGLRFASKVLAERESDERLKLIQRAPSSEDK